MLLDNTRLGDLVIFSDGNQAVIQDKIRTTSGDVYVTFDKKVTGWINGTKYRQWAYHRDGRFVLSGCIKLHGRGRERYRAYRTQLGEPAS